MCVSPISMTLPLTAPSSTRSPAGTMPVSSRASRPNKRICRPCRSAASATPRRSASSSLRYNSARNQPFSKATIRRILIALTIGWPARYGVSRRPALFEYPHRSMIYCGVLDRILLVSGHDGDEGRLSQYCCRSQGGFARSGGDFVAIIAAAASGHSAALALPLGQHGAARDGLSPSPLSISPSRSTLVRHAQRPLQEVQRLRPHSG